MDIRRAFCAPPQKSLRLAKQDVFACVVIALVVLRSPVSTLFERSGGIGGMHAEIVEELVSVFYLTLILMCVELCLHNQLGPHCANPTADGAAGLSDRMAVGEDRLAVVPALRLVNAMVSVSM
ncbi:unnamed protein product [Prorocentrum cordatum]|uniref:Membrane magnesium transporter n=1 Tax=Prorocentrum cordatum TaxID=2364126 RepID=A0ABN9VL70_9DINO|nr:unnamed protein product [Polarella glacialis]|mmetsp:Transcript_83321/g.217619  ORF Transcript_83321/g.217619 Transcript_83321/m.217619 type:complete len:123 (+) Transcript_83321:95-463(+)